MRINIKYIIAMLVICMYLSLNILIKAKANEFVLDDTMLVTESITVKLEQSKKVPMDFEKYVAYTDSRMPSLALYNENESRIEIDGNKTKAQITSTLTSKKGRFIIFWNWNDLNEFLNGRKTDGWKANVDLNSINVTFAEIKATNQTFRDNDGTIIKNPCETENSEIVEKPGPNPGPGGETPNPGTGEEETGLLNGIKEALDAIKNFFANIAQFIKSLFVPEDGFFKGWVNKIKEKFSFIIDIYECFETINDKILGAGVGEVAIWVDLPEKYGGRQKVIDFRLIEDKMQTVRKWTSAFIYLSFGFATFKKLPALISGASIVTEKAESKTRRKER